MNSKYDLVWYDVTPSGEAIPGSDEVVGNGKWLPMTHEEACVARSKFTIPPGKDIRLEVRQ